MVQVYARGQEQNAHDGVFLCVRVCVRSHHVSGADDEEEEGEESHFPD